ncbi:MAG: sulfotransferase family protein [Gemmobacter sp.]
MVMIGEQRGGRDSSMKPGRKRKTDRLAAKGTAAAIAGTGPDFFVLGPPRTASTWLESNLARHPQIWMPPVKELHYFDVQRRGRIDNRYRNLHYEQFRKRRKMTEEEFATYLEATPNSWPARYLNAERDDAWYCSLFAAEPGQIRGEATPTYIRLSEATIATALELAPQLKVIATIRHPLFRLVSLVGKMVRDTGKDPADLDEERLAHLVAANNDAYAGNLDRWERLIDADRRMLIWFEDIVRDGSVVLDQVAAFLGAPADAGWSGGDGVSRVVNASPDWDVRRLDAAIREAMVAAVDDELTFLEARDPARTGHWRALAGAWRANPDTTQEVTGA